MPHNKNTLTVVLLTWFAMSFPASAAEPVRFDLDTTTVRYVVAHGIGGNYCFGIDSPVSAITLKQLKPPVVRTEMVLRDWEPSNDNNDPGTPDWDSYRAQDKDLVRHRFKFMSDLTRRKVPYMVAVWGAPKWISTGRGPIAREQWGELIESISTFLQHARNEHGAEPDYFTFNEPDFGVDVKLSPEEHRDMIKLLGAEFERHGLKTKLTLADAHKPSPAAYVQPTVADPEAMKYVGVVSFHSWWYENKPEHLSQWADLAERLKLPLWVAEAGVNAMAWRDKSMDRFEYGIEEVVLYQRLLIHARPQAILYWEYTSDYSLLDKDLKPTERFAFMRHWAHFIPQGSEALTGELKDGIYLTAFRDPKTSRVAIHLANPTEQPREVRLTGLPSGVESLHAVRTSRGELFQEIEGPKILERSATVELPPQSLTTCYTKP